MRRGGVALAKALRAPAGAAFPQSALPAGTSSFLPAAAAAANTGSAEGARGISLQIVKQRMRSVGNIGKITKAMKMVAASRLRGTQEKMERSRGIVKPFPKLLGDSPASEFETTCVVPITSDKGLCGGINSSVVKYTKVVGAVTAELGSTMDLKIIGEKGRAQLVRGEENQLISTIIVDAFKTPPTFVQASMVAEKVLESGFEKAQIVFNQYKSAIAFKPTITTVLSPEALEKVGEEGLLIDTYEVEGPDRSEFLLDLYEFQTGCVMYNGMLENAASELGSRMQAMENSSKNAGEMLQKLTLTYNRTRQAAITTELIEIISGASALEG